VLKKSQKGGGKNIRLQGTSAEGTRRGWETGNSRGRTKKNDLRRECGAVRRKVRQDQIVRDEETGETQKTKKTILKTSLRAELGGGGRGGSWAITPSERKRS